MDAHAQQTNRKFIKDALTSLRLYSSNYTLVVLP